MDTWSPVNWALLIPIVAIVGAFTFVIVQTVMKSRVRELEIRQRIAMIERGLVPPPEVDPKGFERAMASLEGLRPSRVSTAAARHRRSGIILLGVGFGLMLLIGVTGDEPSAGIGVGGFLVAVGLAFLANAWFEMRSPTVPPSAPAEPPTPPVPPAVGRAE